jgi:hypothetical protein
MILCRRPLILWVDVAGILSVCALAVGLITLVALPLSRSRGELPALQDELSTTNHERRAFGKRNGELSAALDQRGDALRAQSPQALIDAGAFLERISSECASRGLELTQLEPQQGADEGAYKTWKVRVRARGPFPAFVDLLAEIESWTPYLHVGDLEITGPRDASVSTCDFAWVLQVNLLESAAPPAKQGAS